MIPSPPQDRRGFEIALVCALPLEANYVEQVFDKFWEDEDRHYGKAYGDPNTYTPGLIAGHNVVLAYMPGMGKVSAAQVASSLKISFPHIKLAIVVGICGGMPYDVTNNQEIYLGDVVISKSLLQYDFGRQYLEGFLRKDAPDDSLGRAPHEIRSVLAKLQTYRSRQKLQDEIATYLSGLQRKDPGLAYPGTHADKLYESTYIHKHHDTSDSFPCAVCSSTKVCFEAKMTNCRDLGCDDSKLVRRKRSPPTEDGSSTFPNVHYGKVASGDSVMKSSSLRDQMSRNNGIIAFEMEGAGLWEYFPSIIVKGVCDYADSHKGEEWQPYAAAAAACCLKALLKLWSQGDKQPLAHSELDANMVQTTPESSLKSISVSASEALWHVPFDHIPGFVGRQAEVSALQTKLLESGRGQRMAVFGLGGVGKSRIALEVANIARSLGNYSVFWVQSNSMSSLEKDYLEIGRQLGVPGLANKGADMKRLVRDWLSSESKQRWLMVLDNADDEAVWNPQLSQTTGTPSIMEYIPKSHIGSLLITTRSRRVAVQLAGKEVIELQQINESEAVDILTSALINPDEAMNSDVDSPLTLVLRLSCLPLAIVQAAGYINVNDITIHDYLDLLGDTSEENIIELLSEDFEDEIRPQAQNSIASTWLISFKQIQQMSSKAIDFLSIISCFKEKDIPQKPLTKVTSKKEFIDVIGMLTSYSFIRKQAHKQAGQPLYDVHRLVRLATRSWLRREQLLETWTCRAVSRMVEVFLDGDDIAAHGPEWALYMPHAEALCAATEGWQLPDRYVLLRKLGNRLYSYGTYKAAATYFACMLAECTKAFGELDDKTLWARHRLGSTLTRAGKWTESQHHLSEALIGHSKLYGEEDRRTIKVLGSLAHAYRKQGHWTKAEELETQALEVSTRTLGAGDPITLQSIDNLAIIYQKQSRLQDAERLHSNVVEASKKVLGPEHPKTLSRMRTLAKLLLSLGRTAEAAPFDMEALEVERRILGPNHHKALEVMAVRAKLYRQQGHLQEAEDVISDVLTRSKIILGPEHPDTLSFMVVLAGIYDRQERYADCQRLNSAVLDTSARVLGAEHPVTLDRMSNLANSTVKNGSLQDAIEILSKCVELCTKKFGAQGWQTRARKERLDAWIVRMDGQLQRDPSESKV